MVDYLKEYAEKIYTDEEFEHLRKNVYLCTSIYERIFAV